MTDEDLKNWEAKLKATPGHYVILNPDESMEMLETAAVLSLIHEVQDLRAYAQVVRVATKAFVNSINIKS